MGEGGQRVLNKQIPKELAHIMCFGGKNAQDQKPLLISLLFYRLPWR